MSLPKISPNNWFFFAHLDELENSTIKKTILGKEYIAYRDKNNQVIVAANYCLHRGYPLSSARLIDNEIECPYHGWRFGEDGICSKIPGNSSPPKIKLKIIENETKNSSIWVNINNVNVASPEVSTLGPHALKITYNTVVKAPLYLLIENTLDPLHTPFVHRGLVRSARRKDVKIQIDTLNNQVQATYLNEGIQSGLISKLFGSSEDLGIGRYKHPGILQLEYKNSKKTKMLITSYLTPLSESETASYIQIEYEKLSFRLDIILKPIFNLLIKHVIKQDIDIVEEQYINLKKQNKDRFVSTELDFLTSYLKEIIKTNGQIGKASKKIEINL